MIFTRKIFSKIPDKTEKRDSRKNRDVRRKNGDSKFSVAFRIDAQDNLLVSNGIESKDLTKIEN